MTNAEFAKTDKKFIKACSIVRSDFKPSARQASKWRRRKGIAWKTVNGKQ